MTTTYTIAKCLLNASTYIIWPILIFAVGYGIYAMIRDTKAFYDADRRRRRKKVPRKAR